MKTKRTPLLIKKKKSKRKSPVLLRVKKTPRVSSKNTHLSNKRTKVSESMFADPFEFAPLAYQSLAGNGCFIQVNQSWLDAMLYSRQEVIGHWFGDFLTAESKKLFQERFPLFKASGLAEGVEFEMKRKDGSCFTASFNGKVMYDSQGRFKQTHCIFFDVTARKKADLELKESEERFKCIFDNVSDGILLADVQTMKLVLGNRMICSMLGYDLQELLGLTVNDLHPARDMPYVKEVIKKQFSRKKPLAENIPVKRKDGSVFYVDINSSLFVLNGKRYLLGLFRDITERKASAEALRQSEDKLRAFYESNVIGVLFGNIQGDILNANDELLRIIGYTREELGRGVIRWIDLTPPEFLPLDEQGIREAQACGVCTPYEKQYIRKDGSRVWVLVGYTLLGKQREESVAFILDLTERKRVQEALRKSEAFLNNVFDLSPHSQWISDENGMLIKMNQACRDLLHIKDKDVVGKYNVLKDNIVESQGFMPLVRSVYERGERVKFTLKYNTGELQQFDFKHKVSVILEVQILPLKNSDGKVINAIIQHVDITERTQAEAALLASESRYRSIVENINDALYIHDFEGVIMDVNENACRMTGYSRDDLVGASLAKIDCPENTRLMEKHMQQLLRDGKVEFDGQHMKKGRSCVWVTVSAKIVSRSGKGIVQGFVKDITERKLAEEKIKAALIEKELLLRELNHRVKNNLQVINSLLNLQAHKIKDEEVRGILRESHLRIKSIAMVHEKLYSSSDFSRIDMKEYLNSLVRSIAHSFNIVDDTVSLKVMADEGIWFNMDMVIHCGLIINELVTNAFKYAFPDNRKGEVCVELKAGKNNVYELVVRDNGIGLPKDFDMKSSRTLGLELVNILARQLGEIKLLRTEGTAFKLTLNKGKEL